MLLSGVGTRLRSALWYKGAGGKGEYWSTDCVGRAIESVCLSPVLHCPVTAGGWSLHPLLMAAAAAWILAHTIPQPTLQPWRATGCWWTREFSHFVSCFASPWNVCSLETARKLLVTVHTPQGLSLPRPPLCLQPAFLLIRFRGVLVTSTRARPPDWGSRPLFCAQIVKFWWTQWESTGRCEYFKWWETPEAINVCVFARRVACARAF